MPREQVWRNKDGLVVGFGTHTHDNRVPGVTAEKGTPVKVAKFTIVGTAIEQAGSLTVASFYPQQTILRRGARIQRAVFQVVTPFTSGGAATLSLGTYKYDPTNQAAVVVDVAAGIHSAAALTTIDAIGEILICTGTLVNATIPVGATSDTDVVIAPSWGTAAFTAGEGILVVEYVEPGEGNETLAV